MIKSILVVARQSPHQAALLARLEAEGYLAIPAESRDEAWEILRAMVPGAMFVDLSMPARQGRRFTNDLAGEPHLRMVPRLVVLGAWRRDTRPVSAAAVFVKPLDLDHVVRALGAVYPAATSVAPVAPLPSGADPSFARPAPTWDDENIAAALAG